MRKALQDIVANLTAQGITVYPEGTPLEKVPDTGARIVYSWNFEPLQITAFKVKGTLAMDFTVVSYASDREDAVWTAAENLQAALWALYPQRCRVWIASGTGDENNMNLQVHAEFVNMEQGGTL